MKDFLKELDDLDRAFCDQMLAERRQDKLKEDPIEELEEVMVSVEEIEAALQKCSGIARFAIQKHHELHAKHQKVLIDMRDLQYNNSMLENQRKWMADDILKNSEQVSALQKINYEQEQVIHDQEQALMDQEEMNMELEKTKFGQDMVILGLKNDLNAKIDEIHELQRKFAQLDCSKDAQYGQDDPLLGDNFQNDMGNR